MVGLIWPFGNWCVFLYKSFIMLTKSMDTKFIWPAISYTFRLDHSHETISYVSFVSLFYELSGSMNPSNPWAVAMTRVLLCRHITIYGGFTLEGNCTSGGPVTENWKVMWPKPNARELYKFPEWKQKINARFQPHMVVKIFKGKFQEAKILLFPL